MGDESAGRIFISYRRKDTPHAAGRLFDRLEARYGTENVFVDVSSIEPGMNFAEAIEKAVGDCDVLLALIGQQWIGTAGDHGLRRLEDPDDVLALEITTALRRGIRVIPVLVDGAPRPRRDELPEPLTALAGLEVVQLDHPSFCVDADALMDTLDRVIRKKQLGELEARFGAKELLSEPSQVFDPDAIAWLLETVPRYQMRSLTELRKAIEPQAASLAAQRASADACRDLISLSQQLRALGTDERFKATDEAGARHRAEYADVDARFHETLLRGSKNYMFIALRKPAEMALRFRIKEDWEGAPDLRCMESHAHDAVTRFPRRPESAALWFHQGLAYSIDQGLSAAAEAFACAILAEVRTDGLQDPVLLFTLRHALDLLDIKRFPEEDREEFENTIRHVVNNGCSSPGRAVGAAPYQADV